MKSEDKKLSLYEFITPSDQITFKAPNDKVAQVCAFLLGRGKAGCERIVENGDRIRINAMFWFENPEPVLEKDLGMKVLDFIEKYKVEICECFETFAYGGVTERKIYDEACEAITDKDKLDQFKKNHEDRMRTSMSQWVKHAWKIAADMSKKK